MQVSGNTILITGGGSGIGAALAHEWHEAGNKVIIAGRRQEALDAVASAHPGMEARTVDMGDAASIRALADGLLTDFPALNAVVHNAGVMVAEERIDLAIAEATVATNLLGPIRLTHALLPHLLAQPHASIVTVSSGLAFVPLVATPTYDGTKAAIHNWSIALRAHLMPGHADDARMMPLADFIAETMSLIRQQPTPAEIQVERVKFLSEATKRGEFDQVFAALNGGH